MPSFSINELLRELIDVHNRRMIDLTIAVNRVAHELSAVKDPPPGMDESGMRALVGAIQCEVKAVRKAVENLDRFD